MDKSVKLSSDRAAYPQRQAVALMEHQGMTPYGEDIADGDLFLAGEITEMEFLARVAALLPRM